MQTFAFPAGYLPLPSGTSETWVWCSPLPSPSCFLHFSGSAKYNFPIWLRVKDWICFFFFLCFLLLWLEVEIPGTKPGLVPFPKSFCKIMKSTHTHKKNKHQKTHKKTPQKTALGEINLISGWESDVGSTEQKFCGVRDQRCQIHSKCGKSKCPGSKQEPNSAPKPSVSNGRCQGLKLTDLFWFYDVIIFKLGCEGQIYHPGLGFLISFLRTGGDSVRFYEVQPLPPCLCSDLCTGFIFFCRSLLVSPPFYSSFFSPPAQSRSLHLWCVFLQ